MGVSAAVAVGASVAYFATEYDVLLSVAVPSSLGSGALLFMIARLWQWRTHAPT
jgi:hypothetical protein